MSRWHRAETFGEIKYESCYCARACALPTGTVCAFERRKNCHQKRTEKMKKSPEFESLWKAKQLFFFRTFGSLRTLRLGAAAWQTGCSEWELWGYPIPAPRHCGQAEIYAHCRKQASIHWLQPLHKSGSLLPQQLRRSEQRDQLRDRPVICKA